MYYIILGKLFGSCDLNSLLTIHLALESLESGSSSSWAEDSFGINVLLEPSSTAEATLSNFRAQNANVETELFSRIRGLEAQLSHGLPPQLNRGEYERLVRENLDSAVSIRHYREALDHELFELKIMEKGGNLQERLFNRMISEPRI